MGKLSVTHEDTSNRLTHTNTHPHGERERESGHLKRGQILSAFSDTHFILNRKQSLSF